MEVDSKEPCKYGVDCYQRNENHHKRFSHPPKPPNSPATSKSPEQKRKLSPESAKLSETCEENSKKFKATNLSEPSRSLESEHQASSNDNETLSDPIENEEEENGDLLQTSKLFIKEKFLFDMPEDFYAFWEFCVSQSKGNQKPEEIFKKFGLNLVGPFDVLAGKFNEQNQFEPEDYLRHWRYYYDPPEFQTVFQKDKSSLHYGYWRDDPDDKCFIAKNDASKNCEFSFVADNLFLAAIHYLDEDLQLTPFNRPSALAMKKSLENFAKERNICVDVKEYLNNLKARNVKTVCKTFHRAGLIVAFNRKTTVGYRPLIETEATLKQILNKFKDAQEDTGSKDAAMDQLLPIITAANIALDESDFGTSIELGMDVFCSGISDLHNTALQLLTNGYTMVNRPQFVTIIQAHLAKRGKSDAPSILNN